MRAKQVDRIEDGAAGTGGVLLPYAPGIPAALAVRVKPTDRIEDEAAGAGGALLPLARGVLAAPAVGFKQAG
ncbi:hypothetical protein [Sansalvadorimonas verongulae]|uniref:hypothetical protein n=1 Tax=Sansalvadorimonas verongulae TaxID=2172824 RepID=UPI0012BD316E|nr:hypothetical protein [Sansalvadorimonas verongulae]MTI11984.1 hypothetical protein [Sansalvadorimonas verongulae]